MSATPINSRTNIAQRIYDFIEAFGATDADEIAHRFGVARFAAGAWLGSQAARGYLHRDASGAFSTSCPWPSARQRAA